MARRFRIHPSVGVARVGNSPDEFFIGPEQPSVPANWEGNRFGNFRDSQGRIKRQAARFRLYEYITGADGTVRAIEAKVEREIADIEWRVHLANKKGSFFTFNGQSGAADLYVKRAAKPATTKEKDRPDRRNLRNATVPPGQRREVLEIDPGEKVVSKDAKGSVSLTNLNPHVPFIADLGEIRTDEDGRLLVLGGHGAAGSTAVPPVAIDEYANNDTWFDDVGDGSVRARVRFTDGSSVDADAAWLIVGPPDFAPSVTNAVTLYDLMWDVAVRVLPESGLVGLPDFSAQRKAWAASGGKSLDGYAPSFLREIYPILARAVAVRGLHQPFPLDEGTFHVKLMNWAVLASKEPATPQHDPPGLRRFMFNRIRHPDAKKIDWKGMPRGLGDDYDTLEDSKPKPTALFSLTRIQFALLEQWAEGNFVADWPGSEPGIPQVEAATPAGLDRAALENCVGGPFFPGIEVSWLVRRPELYAEPFRFDVQPKPEGENGAAKQIGALTFGPGFFSQQMAQPWHADFFDCHKEENEDPNDHRPYYYMWWTAQRPDDTFAPGADAKAPWVRHIVPRGKDFDEVTQSDERFVQIAANWPNLPFVIPNSGRLEEEPR